ncbi:hypothetical protein ANO11243_007670 [Dothideomycetidae sp. 11243]|nr:hypothetical protein ANO11243_007670 [fungal sp. No.11243]
MGKHLDRVPRGWRRRPSQESEASLIQLQLPSMLESGRRCRRAGQIWADHQWLEKHSATSSQTSIALQEPDYQPRPATKDDHPRPPSVRIQSSPAELIASKESSPSETEFPVEHSFSEAEDTSGVQHPKSDTSTNPSASLSTACSIEGAIDPSLLTSSADAMPGLESAEMDSLLGPCDLTALTPLSLQTKLDFEVDDVLGDNLHDSALPPSAGADSFALIPHDYNFAKARSYKPLPVGLSFALDSVEMIAVRFDQLTCAILSVKNGQSENPWRSLVWPMAQSSPSLFHAICAMTAFHSSKREPQFKVKGHEHMQLCLKNLSEGFRDDSVTLENAIATSITLAFAQGFSELTSSGNVFIKGARSIIGKALTQHQQSPRHGLALARLKFLCNAWVYMDVIVRLTSDSEDGLDEVDEYEQIFATFSIPSTDPEGFGIDFGLPVDACLDPLMGCANTLFPLVGRTANLARRVRRSSSSSLAVIDHARELKELIEAWRPPMYIQPPEDPSSTVEHSVQTAEAYRWATLLYLHQTVPEIPMATSSQLATKVLILLATVPLSSRFVIVHIFPLMAAGCEAVSSEDREWVRYRWAAMGRRLDIGSIDKCVEITEEVWRRRDEIDPRGRQSLVSTASLQSHEGRRTSHDLDLGGIPSNWKYGRIGTGCCGIDTPVSMAGELGWPQVIEWDGNGDINSQYYLGGRLHWLGVMREWGWEVLLG